MCIANFYFMDFLLTLRNFCRSFIDTAPPFLLSFNDNVQENHTMFIIVKNTVTDSVVFRSTIGVGSAEIIDPLVTLVHFSHSAFDLKETVDVYKLTQVQVA